MAGEEKTGYKEGYQDAEIKRLCECVEKLEDQIKGNWERTDKLMVELGKKVDTLVISNAEIKTEMKVKSGIWGGVSGFIIAVGVLFIKWAMGDAR
jgi:hypothetical protein